MSRYPDELLARIREAVPLSGLVGRSVQWDKRKTKLRKSDHWSPCPFHAEKTSSFHVLDHEHRYYCFGCKAKGDHFTWMMEREGMSFPEAVEELARQGNIELPKRSAGSQAQQDRRERLFEVMAAADHWYRGRWRAKTLPGVTQAADYLKRRGVTGETAKTFGLGYAPQYGLVKHLEGAGFTADDMVEAGLAKKSDRDGQLFDRFRERIMFPIHDAQGRVIAFGGRAIKPDAKVKYLNSPATPLYDKSRVLYNWHRARKAAAAEGEIVSVEGYMDVIALHQAGLENVVAACGTALTLDHLQLMWRHAREPVVCFDGDKAGQAAAVRTADEAFPNLVPGQSLRFMVLDGGKDPADLMADYTGMFAFADAYEQAEPLHRFMWARLEADNDRTTPERQARFKQDVMALLSSIRDVDVRRTYARLFERMLFWATGERRNLTRLLAMADRRDTRAPGPRFDRFGSENGRVSGHREPSDSKRGAEGADELAGSTLLEPHMDDETNLACAQLPMTDLGNVERMLKRFGHMFLWCGPIGWLAWDGRRWATKNAELAFDRAVQDMVRAIPQEAAALASSDFDDVYRPETKTKPAVMLSEAVAAWGMQSQSASKVNCIEKLAKSYLAVGKDQLDADPFKLNVENGTLHLNGQSEQLFEFRAHDPADLMTQMAGTHYDPDAVCPVFAGFMEKVQPALDDRQYLQRWAGSCLTGSIADQKVHFWFGHGRNGKSTCIDALAEVLGDYAATVPIESFLDNGRPKSGGEARPDLVQLDGARLVRTSEPERGQKLAESLIKLATGGEPMLVRALHRDPFELRPVFKLAISGNSRPNVKGADDGIWRRLREVPWLTRIPDDDVDAALPDKIRAQLPGLLNWMLEGWQNWRTDGLGSTENIDSATSQYRDDSDPLGAFLSVCVERTDNDDDRVQSADMFELWQAFRTANGFPEWSQTGFSRAMTESPGMRKKRSNVIWWLGVRLVKQPSDFIDQDGKPLRQAKDG